MTSWRSTCKKLWFFFQRSCFWSGIVVENKVDNDDDLEGINVSHGAFNHRNTMPLKSKAIHAHANANARKQGMPLSACLCLLPWLDLLPADDT
jgi:hypothetical protein